MAVVLADRQLTVRVHAHPFTRDDRGMPVPGGDVVTRGPYPGAAKEQPDASWSLRLDPRCWPVRAGDRITDGTLTWVAAPDPKLQKVPGVPDVDHITVTGTLDPPRVP